MKDHLTTRSWLLPLVLLLGFGSTVIGQYEPNTFLHGDGSFYAAMNRSLLDGTLVQRGYQPASWYESKLGWNHHIDPGWSNISLGGDGQTWYPKHPTLMPLVATSLFVPLGYVGLLVFNLLSLVLGLWGAFRLASRFTKPTTAALATLALATLPIFTRNAYAYSNDVFYGALVVWGYERFFAGRFAVAGLLLGLSIWAKATNAVLGLPLGVTLLVQRRWRDAGWLAVMTAAPVSVHLAMNAWMFGSPWTTSYHRVLVMVRGKQAISDVRDSFGREVTAGLSALWSDRFEGLNKNAWMFVPALLGCAPLWRQSRALAVTLCVSLPLYLLLFVPYEYTYARFFLPWALLWVTPFALLMHRLPSVDWSSVKVRRVTLALVLAVWALMAVVRLTPEDGWRAADHITEAVVTRGEGRAATPCDYFNLRHMKWECAVVDREPWQRSGKAVAKECSFDKMAKPSEPFVHGDDWIWVHPNPGVSRTMVFHPPEGDVLVRFGLAKRSRFGSAKLQVRAGKAPAQTWTVTGIGRIHERVISADERSGSLELKVPIQPHDWRHLCVAIRVKDAPR